MYVKLNGEMVYLWRAVDQEGEILESYITKTRNKEAALTLMMKALKRYGSPEKITTDGLRSFRAAMNGLGNAVRQEIGRWANNRIENSHLSFRRRERAMQRFRRMKTLQRFASIHANAHNHINQERHLVDQQTYKVRCSAALDEPHGLSLSTQSQSSDNRRRVAIRLTAPYTTLADTEGGMDTPYSVDGIHPSKAGYGVMARLLVPVVKHAIRQVG